MSHYATHIVILLLLASLFHLSEASKLFPFYTFHCSYDAIIMQKDSSLMMGIPSFQVVECEYETSRDPVGEAVMIKMKKSDANQKVTNKDLSFDCEYCGKKCLEKAVGKGKVMYSSGFQCSRVK